MLDTIKSLVAKVWKDEAANLCVGKHEIDECLIIRVTGKVEKCEDEMATPTVSIPLIPTLALFWEKCGIGREAAMQILREAIVEAMDDGVQEHAQIKSRIDDVNAAIKAVRKDLLEKLPKMPRTGKVLTKNLKVTIKPLSEVNEPQTAAVD
jgi:hypothetical protein